jgi:peroxiredoxin
LRKSYNEITKKHLKIVVVVPTTWEQIDNLVEAYGPYPFSIYGDPSHALYKDLGHVYLSKAKFWPKVASLAISSAIKGTLKDKLPQTKEQKAVFKKSMDTQNIYLQGGTWLFNPEGEVIWKHRDKSPDDHVSIKEIIEVINTNI